MDEVRSKVEKPSLKSALRLHFRILTFQATREELASLGSLHLALGLAWTWLAGIGRWWDDPGASLLQHLGLGSLAYVFLLSLVLWLVALPLRPKDLTYLRTLNYVTLTAPPALLYAIPVERWYGIGFASTLNVWFLGLVAIWRIALYCTFLSRGNGLSGVRTALATFLPVMLNMVVLTILNLERATINIMGGLRQPSAADAAYLILNLVTALSFCGSVIAVPVYLFQVSDAHSDARGKSKRGSSQPPDEKQCVDANEGVSDGDQ